MVSRKNFKNYQYIPEVSTNYGIVYIDKRSRAYDELTYPTPHTGFFFRLISMISFRTWKAGLAKTGEPSVTLVYED